MYTRGNPKKTVIRVLFVFMRSSRMRDESIKDLHMGKSEVGTRGVLSEGRSIKEGERRGEMLAAC